MREAMGKQGIGTAAELKRVMNRFMLGGRRYNELLKARGVDIKKTALKGKEKSKGQEGRGYGERRPKNKPSRI